MEGELADQKLGGLLVATNFTKGDGAGPVTVRLLHTTSLRGGLASGLGSQLLSGSLPTVKRKQVNEVSGVHSHGRGHQKVKRFCCAVHTQWTCGRFAWYGPL